MKNLLNYFKYAGLLSALIDLAKSGGKVKDIFAGVLDLVTPLVIANNPSRAQEIMDLVAKLKDTLNKN